MTVSSRSRLIAGGGAAVLAVVLGLGLAGCPGDSVAEVGLEAKLPELRARLAATRLAPTR
jgi:hypothetical protein